MGHKAIQFNSPSRYVEWLEERDVEVVSVQPIYYTAPSNVIDLRLNCLLVTYKLN